MKNLLAYTPEPFDNLEYAPLVGGAELEQEECEAGRRRRRSSSRGLRRPSYLNTRRPQQSPAAEPQGGSGGSTSSVGGGSPAGQDGSEHVRWVQETLNRALGLRLMVDGIMNRETRSAVRLFQERKGLPVTGLVGPDTEKALKAAFQQTAAEAALWAEQPPKVSEKAKKNRDAALALWLRYKKMSDVELFKRVADNKDETASAVIRQRYPSNAAALQKILGSDYRPPHSATVVLKRDGRVIWQKTFDSGRMTPSERALGFPKSVLATHTEARAVKQAALQLGDVLEITGQYNPCGSCQRAMQEAAIRTGAVIKYWWPGGSWKIFKP